MKSTKKSRFTTAFKSGIKSGKSCSAVVCNIAEKNGISTKSVYQSLYNCGMCFRQKFNGTWLYWPTFNCKAKATSCNTMQTAMWQCFIDWCCATGCCTPMQLNAHCTSQKNFMSYCKKFFGMQAKSMTKTKKATKSHKKSGKKYGTTTSWTATRNYKFPTFKTKTSTRRYSKVA